MTRLLKVDDRYAVRAAVSQWKAADLEFAVVAAGGCAAAMHDRDSWLASVPGAASAAAPALAVTERPVPAGIGPEPGSRGAATRAEGLSVRPYAGVRVLDLTRVIAGPIGTRFLAAYGADVLRIDPPGFAEVPAALPETTAGKRTADADLTTPAGRAAFERLVAGADVLVTGLRADALDRLGYDDAALTALNPALIITSHNAYGWDGPWRDRRGFDSLVQMSCGIAAVGAIAAGADKPVPLPAAQCVGLAWNCPAGPWTSSWCSASSSPITAVTSSGSLVFRSGREGRHAIVPAVEKVPAGWSCMLRTSGIVA